MALTHFQDYLKIMPLIKKTPHNLFWSSYDEEADVLYINFKKPSYATNSELRDDGVIVRYRGREIIGFTILNANKKRGAT